MRKKVDLTISSNFETDLKQAKNFGKVLSEILEPLKKSGLIDFEAVTKRRCDFCGKELPFENNGEFKTIGDKDKCKDCQKAGK